MSVPFIDLKREPKHHLDEYLSITKRVLESGFFSLGPEVEAFEAAFAAYHGVTHAIGVNGGTWALWAAYTALQLKRGTKVLMPDTTFIATAEAAILAGFCPVFCDVDGSGLMDLAHAEELMIRYPDIRIVVPVHLYGKAVDMDVWQDFAARHHLVLIEDVAQAHGAYWKERRVGSFGVFSCFSFYPTKPLGALGEGGIILTNDAELAERVRAIRLHGILKEKYRHDIFGTNLKMESLQAAFLRAKLARLEAANERRRQIADQYRSAFKTLPLVLPTWSQKEHVFHLFVIQTERRNELQAFLKDKGIGTGIHYPLPLSKQPSMQEYAGFSTCPKAEKMSQMILSLPLFPEMTREEIQEVIDAVKLFFA